MVGNWINLYNSFDQVQVRGGGDGGTIELGPAARTHLFAINVDWNLDFGPVGSHSALHSPAAWDFVKDRLNKTEASGTEKPDVVMVSE